MCCKSASHLLFPHILRFGGDSFPALAGSRYALAQFTDENAPQTACALSGTPLGDHPLTVVAITDEKELHIPPPGFLAMLPPPLQAAAVAAAAATATALELAKDSSTGVGSSAPGGGIAPPGVAGVPQPVVPGANLYLYGRPGPAVAMVPVVAGASLPERRPTSLNYAAGAQTHDEVLRTVYVGNINPAMTNDLLIKFFAVCGPVTFCRMGGEDSNQARFAFMEFGTREAALRAQALNGVPVMERELKVNNSKNPIVKGPVYPDSGELRELKRKIRKAQMEINAEFK
jgi:RNA recognition motif